VDEVIDLAMYNDPAIPVAQAVKVFPPRLKTLWVQALQRPENDLKCQAAATIAVAHQRGMAGLDTTIPPLQQVLDQAEQPAVVRRAAAQALITLDARQTAESLWRHAQTDGIEMRSLVEPALARWDYRPARTVWLERLQQAALPNRGQLLAIQGLGMVCESKAAGPLRELVRSPRTDAILRLEAARALGALQTTGLENDAQHLAAEKAAPGNVVAVPPSAVAHRSNGLAEKAAPGGVAALAAASLLRKHRGDEAAKILLRLAEEAEPAVAGVALDGLLDDDPRRVLPLLRTLVASPDALVRGKAVEAHRRQRRAEDVPLIADLLDDPHPQVRTGARKALIESAQAAELREVVLRATTRMLATKQWRALEQAALALALLDHKPAASRFVELLQFQRPEVFVTAAWGLRKLAVPETLPAQLREIERRWDASLKTDVSQSYEMIDLQVAQLAQALGRARYEPAALVLRRFVPKRWNIGPESRAAAIWSLGWLHEKAPPTDLVHQLMSRVTDDSEIDPEDVRVRRMSAVGLGRMKAQEAVVALKRYYQGKVTLQPFFNACGWALQEITGEKLPASGIVEYVQVGWFLESQQ
jgi:hypothetical protein